MRFVTAAATAALLALPATWLPISGLLAQTTAAPPAGAASPATPPPPAAPSAAAPASGTAAPAAPSTATAPPSGAPAKTAKRHRQTLQQRFDAANTSKDGHLTAEQAKTARWTYVARHFSAIDKTHKGYVTVADIQAYSRAMRAARRHPSTPATEAPAASTNGAPAAAPASGAPATDTPE